MGNAVEGILKVGKPMKNRGRGVNIERRSVAFGECCKRNIFAMQMKLFTAMK